MNDLPKLRVGQVWMCRAQHERVQLYDTNGREFWGNVYIAAEGRQHVTLKYVYRAVHNGSYSVFGVSPDRHDLVQLLYPTDTQHDATT